MKNEVNSVEGDAVILTCSFSKIATAADDLYWYRQETGAPQFLIHLYGFHNLNKADPQNHRLSANLNGGKDHLNLMISSAEVTDSALYYCAVRPTVTGNTDTLYKNLTRRCQ